MLLRVNAAMCASRAINEAILAYTWFRSEQLPSANDVLLTSSTSHMFPSISCHPKTIEESMSSLADETSAFSSRQKTPAGESISTQLKKALASRSRPSSPSAVYRSPSHEKLSVSIMMERRAPPEAEGASKSRAVRGTQGASTLFTN